MESGDGGSNWGESGGGGGDGGVFLVVDWVAEV